MKNKITKKSTIRDVLQILGTDLLRNQFNSNVHVATTIGEIKSEDKVIITDVRFPNELKAIKDRGGISIRVNKAFIPKEGDNIQIKVFSNWSKVLYSHTDENGNHYGYDSDGYKYKSTLIKPISDKHPSETALDDYKDWDYIINNNSSMEDLIVKVKEILIKEKII